MEFPGGQINDPLSEKYILNPFLPAIPSTLPLTLERILELTLRPLRACDSPHVLLSELQRNKDAVRCGKLGMEVPGHRTKQLTQYLIVHL